MRTLVILAAVILAALVPAAGVGPAYGANFTVDSTVDAVDANPGDGFCASAGGPCTLRAAIQESNSLPGADTITLPAGTYTLSIAGADEDANQSGDLDVTADLTIIGTGAATTIIDGAALDRVFDVDPTSADVMAEISGVTIQHGLAQFEGFIFTAGGGILNAGTLTVSSSTVRDNTGVALDHFGGGIFNDGTLTLNNSTLSDNAAVSGGGIRNHGTATLKSSTVSGNATGDSGGGIANVGMLTVDNSTISGNTGFTGGGVSNFIAGTAILSSTTVAANFAGSGAGGIGIAGPLTLKNTIVAKNTTSGLGADCGGNAPASSGHNLDSDGSCGLTAPGDLPGVDPLLGPLAGNGGPTLTHALLAGSAAIDAGSPGCPPPASDQRGVARPQGPACDIGAYEFQDTDGDGVPEGSDNCPTVANAGGQTADSDGDLAGDACDGAGSGNVDCSGPVSGVNSVDALKVLRHSAALPVAQNEPCADIGAAIGGGQVQGDVDCSDPHAVNSIDALKILRAVAGLSVSKPVGCPDVKPP